MIIVQGPRVLPFSVPLNGNEADDDSTLGPPCLISEEVRRFTRLPHTES